MLKNVLVFSRRKATHAKVYD